MVLCYTISHPMLGMLETVEIIAVMTFWYLAFLSRCLPSDVFASICAECLLDSAQGKVANQQLMLRWCTE